MRRLLPAAALLVASATAHAQQAPAPPPPDATAIADKALGHDDEPLVRDYFAELERLALLDRSTGSRELLEEELGRAEALLEAESPLAAAVTLYAIVESPRFEDFSDFPEYQNAEYDLAVALAGTGAHDAARDVFYRVIARGPGALYFAAAHRRLVDLALEDKVAAATLAKLDQLKTNEPLPVEATGERAYLRARVAFDAGDLSAAEGALSTISKKSRLFSSALYLRGVIKARKGWMGDAVAAFCEVAQAPDTDRYTFVIDERYFTLKDLARLALGRVAHEEGRYDDAYYHYFQIPDDSDRLAEALFEAAWSMYQKRELATARDLVAELVKTFPDSTQVPEALLLAGYVELADCKFDDARAKFEAAVKDLTPVLAAAKKAQRTAATRKALVLKALQRDLARRQAKERGEVPPRAKIPTIDDRVLALLRVDPAFERLHEGVRGLRAIALAAPDVAATWRRLTNRVAVDSKGDAPAGVKQVAQEDPAVVDAAAAAELAQDARRLAAEVARDRARVLEDVKARTLSSEEGASRMASLDKAEADLSRIADYAQRARGAAESSRTEKVDPRLRHLLGVDADRAEALALEAGALEVKLGAKADELAGRQVDALVADLQRVIDKAGLGKIDAVIGQKRRYELELEDLAQGRYPPELIEKQVELGEIGDDEEYWPPEDEIWKDEFEGWR